MNAPWDQNLYEVAFTLIFLIAEEVGKIVEGGIFWKKLVHNCNKWGVETRGWKKAKKCGGKNICSSRVANLCLALKGNRRSKEKHIAHLKAFKKFASPYFQSIKSFPVFKITQFHAKWILMMICHNVGKRCSDGKKYIEKFNCDSKITMDV